MLVLALCACVTLALGAAVGKPEIVPKVIYDYDDRIDVYQETDTLIQAKMFESTVALMWKSKLACDWEMDQCVLDADSLGDTLNLCEGVRFAEQPAASYCSGTLISNDRVLTAGHCVTSDEICNEMLVVFNYAFKDEKTLHPIRPSTDVFECKNYFFELESGKGYEKDWGIVQLNRPALTKTPAVTVPANTQADMRQNLFLIGFPSGIPAKITTFAPASNQPWGFFAASDTFGGNSGSGVYTPVQMPGGGVEMHLLGLMVRGRADDYEDRGDCKVNAVVELRKLRVKDIEQHSYAWIPQSRCPTHAPFSVCARKSTACPSGECPQPQPQTKVCHSSCLRCAMGSGHADDCTDCRAGLEIDVRFTDCSGFCVRKGTAIQRPSAALCPGFWPPRWGMDWKRFVAPQPAAPADKGTSAAAPFADTRTPLPPPAAAAATAKAFDRPSTPPTQSRLRLLAFQDGYVLAAGVAVAAAVGLAFHSRLRKRRGSRRQSAAANLLDTSGMPAAPGLTQ